MGGWGCLVAIEGAWGRRGGEGQDGGSSRTDDAGGGECERVQAYIAVRGVPGRGDPPSTLGPALCCCPPSPGGGAHHCYRPAREHNLVVVAVVVLGPAPGGAALGVGIGRAQEDGKDDKQRKGG